MHHTTLSWDLDHLGRNSLGYSSVYVSSNNLFQRNPANLCNCSDIHDAPGRNDTLGMRY
ncbi:MAG TPA: hypothetical protein GX696_03095 [Pseudomonadaceae bacterium]|nr:hypothetical protein [Pseudomonadaceae bacterium]